jgi:hypothetical protein
VTARRIVKHFGLETLEIIENKIERLIARISHKLIGEANFEVESWSYLSIEENSQVGKQKAN